MRVCVCARVLSDVTFARMMVFKQGVVQNIICNKEDRMQSWQGCKTIERDTLQVEI